VKEAIIIYGAGGHGKVIADIIEKSGGLVRGFVDDEKHAAGPLFFGYPMLGSLTQLVELQKKKGVGFSVLVAIGRNPIRQVIAEKLECAGVTFGTAIHPSAQIGRDVIIGEGTVIMANSVINSGSKIGKFCIINTAATVDHDCIIGDYVHLSPGVHLGGTVTIERLSWVGVGAAVINNIHMGQSVIVGAGAVVIRPVESYSVMVGNPAHLIRSTIAEEIKV